MRVNQEKQRKRELYRELENLAAEMNYAIDAVVVEGPHDKKTLTLLGYQKAILVCSRLAHHELAVVIAKKFSNVVILTDFDEQGNYLYKKLTTLFEKNDIKVNHFYRRKFLKLLKKARILTIEGIYNIKLDLFL